MYISFDVDGDISVGEQIWVGFDLDIDKILDPDDLWLLWHGGSHGDPDGWRDGPWIRYWEGSTMGTTTLAGASHMTTLREGGLQG